MSTVSLLVQDTLLPGQPLWQRVPTRDENGRALNDFIMLIPKIGRWPEAKRLQAMNRLRSVVCDCQERVVFADLNLKLNLLWISMRPDPEGCSLVVEAIKAAVPEAKLVASQYEAMMGMAGGERGGCWRRQRGLRWLRVGRP